MGYESMHLGLYTIATRVNRNTHKTEFMVAKLMVQYIKHSSEEYASATTTKWLTSDKIKSMYKNKEINIRNMTYIEGNNQLRGRYHNLSQFASKINQVYVVKIREDGSAIIAHYGYGDMVSFEIWSAKKLSSKLQMGSNSIITNIEKNEQGTWKAKCEHEEIKDGNKTKCRRAQQDKKHYIQWLENTVASNDTIWTIQDFITYMRYNGYDYKLTDNMHVLSACDSECLVMHIPNGVYICDSLYREAPKRCKKIIFSPSVHAVTCLDKSPVGVNHTRIDEIYFQSDGNSGAEFNGTGLTRLEIAKSNMPDYKAINGIYCKCHIIKLESTWSVTSLKDCFNKSSGNISVSVDKEMSNSFNEIKRSVISIVNTKKSDKYIAESLRKCISSKISITTQGNILESLNYCQKCSINIDTQGKYMKSIFNSMNYCDIGKKVYMAPLTYEVSDSFKDCGIGELHLGGKIKLIGWSKYQHEYRHEHEKIVIHTKSNTLNNELIAEYDAEETGIKLEYKAKDGVTPDTMICTSNNTVNHDTLWQTGWPRTINKVVSKGQFDFLRKGFDALTVKVYDSTYFINKDTIYCAELSFCSPLETVILDDNIKKIEEGCFKDTKLLKQIVFGESIEDVGASVIKRLCGGEDGSESLPIAYVVKGSYMHKLLSSNIHLGIILIVVDSVKEAREMIDSGISIKRIPELNRIITKMRLTLANDTYYSDIIDSEHEPLIDIVYKSKALINSRKTKGQGSDEQGNNNRQEEIIFGKKPFIDNTKFKKQDVSIKAKAASRETVPTKFILSLASILTRCTPADISEIKINRNTQVNEITDNCNRIIHIQNNSNDDKNNKDKDNKDKDWCICILQDYGTYIASVGEAFKALFNAYMIKGVIKGVSGYNLSLDTSNVVEKGDLLTGSKGTVTEMRLRGINFGALMMDDDMQKLLEVLQSSIATVNIPSKASNINLCIDCLTDNFLEVRVRVRERLKQGFKGITGIDELTIVNKYSIDNLMDNNTKSVYSSYIRTNILGIDT